MMRSVFIVAGGAGGNVSPSKPSVTKIHVFVRAAQWRPGYLFQISCACRHFSQAFFWARPAEEYKVVFTYLPLRSQCLPKAACDNVRFHGNILAEAGNFKEQATCSGFLSSFPVTQFFTNEVMCIYGTTHHYTAFGHKLIHTLT